MSEAWQMFTSAEEGNLLRSNEVDTIVLGHDPIAFFKKIREENDSIANTFILVIQALNKYQSVTSHNEAIKTDSDLLETWCVSQDKLKRFEVLCIMLRDAGYDKGDIEDWIEKDKIGRSSFIDEFSGAKIKKDSLRILNRVYDENERN